MNNDNDIISRQVHMFELSKHIEAKSEYKWTQFQRDIVPFLLWKISESEEGMSYHEVLSCLEQYDSLRPLSPRYKVDVLLSLSELSECGVLEQSEDCDNYDDEHCKFIWRGEEGNKEMNNDRIDIYKLDLNEENEMEKKVESEIVKEYLKKYYENKQQMKELIDSEKQFKKELIDKLSQELQIPREKMWVVGLTVGIDNYPVSEELIENIQQISVSHCMTTNKKNIEFALDDYDNDIEL